MKKILTILLCLTYTFVACGFTINLHYCGGKIKSASFLKITEEGCCGTKEKSKGCCKDKSTFFKIKDNHKLDSAPKTANQTLQINVIVTELLFCLPKSSIASSILNYHAPPVLYDNPIYLKHQVFLI